MNRVSRRYLLQRIAMFLFTVWISATIMFIIPRLAPGDPIQTMIGQLQLQQGRIEGGEEMVAAWRTRFGLDGSLPEQYARYVGNMSRLDMGYSLTRFPASVSSMVARALPWSIALLTLATLISFVLGSLIGALLGWRRTPGLLKLFLPLALTFTSIPFYILAILMMYIFAFKLGWFPISGSAAIGLQPGFDWEFIKSAVTHGMLPALSIVIASMGFWALGLRGMMITVEGEDYLMLAWAKGLSPTHVFLRYAVRNAILPQITALALSFSGMISGSILVEQVYGYPGMGTLLYRGIVSSDYTIIQGVVFIMIVTTSFAVLLIDLINPLLDPRISY